MRREDVPLEEGAKLVILREGGEHYARLLIQGKERPTFVTPHLPLDPFDYQSLIEGSGFFRCYVGTMLLLVDDHALTITLGDYTNRGQRSRLTQALNRIAV